MTYDHRHGEPVRTDHGGSKNRHGPDFPEHGTVFLMLDGSSVETGAVDVRATAMAHLGLEADLS